jgi:DNA repair exonuclease SbcCD ATPase subunit
MSEQQAGEADVDLVVRNVGGIEETAVSFDAGVTVLTGRNATNRTSFLQAIMAALGSDRASLKGDADEGHVRLRLGDTEYTRELRRRGETVVTDGEPYLDDPELADLFAFLLESNEARRAVALEQNLRDIMLRPVDTAAIEAEIRQLKQERSTVEDRIEQRESRKETLTELHEKRADLDERIAETEADLAEKREALEAQSVSPGEAEQSKSELESELEALQEAESDLDTVEYQLEDHHESIDSLETERAELEAELDRLAEREVDDHENIEAEIERLREQRQTIETELNRLQNVIGFNEEMLEGASKDIAAALRGEEEPANPTERLLEPEDGVVCWTCGTPVDEADIEETLERLRELRRSKYSEQSDIESDLEELKERKSKTESVRSRRADVEEQLADVRAEIERRTDRIEELETRRDELAETVAELETTVEELETEAQSETLDLQRTVNRLELELDRLRSRREETVDRIAEVEEQLEAAADLETRRESINDQLEELRTRVDRIERDAVEAFNEHMDTVLDILEYANLDRVWIERVETETRQGRQTVSETAFRLHIVRSTDDGVTYEDAFEHLSESEREVTGLVFALAGYLVHDVHETVPFLLLDSLEAIDAERIANLVEYVATYADYLVVALLEEDAAALDDGHTRVREI